MMKRLLLSVLLVGFGASMQGQAIIDTILEERFDSPPILDTTYNVPTPPFSLPAGLVWQVYDSIPLAPSAPNSYRARGASNPGVVRWETPVLDFSGKTFITMRFRHIAKTHLTDRGRIYVSKDGGTTYQQVITNPTSANKNANYLGLSPNYAQNDYFNELSYPSPPQGGLPSWMGPTTTTTPSAVVWPANNWWVEEVFDLSDLLGDTTTNQSNVIIRFSHEFPATSAFVPQPAFMPGWFIDDLFLIGSNCELEDPVISFNITPALPFNNQPTNLQPCAGDYRVALNATDNVAIDSVELFYRFNGGPWTLRIMPNVVGDRYLDTIPNCQPGDTIEWYVRAFDVSCPNSTRRPADTTQFYKFWIGDTPPAKCGSWFQCGFVNVPFIQNTLPWVVDFQDPEWVPGLGDGTTGAGHRGNMPIAQGNKDWGVIPPLSSGFFGWSVRQGTSMTLLSGPNVDNTLGTPNGKYLIAPPTQGTGFAQTNLTSHCVEVPADSCLYIQFFYYMYGENVQTLRLDIDTGANTEVWVTGVWELSGQQQTGPNQPWRRAFIPLGPEYSGKTLRFRWNATRLGNNPRGNIAIDDIRVDYAVPNDVEASILTRPIGEGCSFSTNEAVTMIVQNIGCNDAVNIPVAYRINAGTPVWDTIPGPIAMGDTVHFTFSQGANILAVGTYEFQAWTALPGDPTPANDSTNRVTVVTVPIISTFPHVLDFDGPGNTSGNGTFANPGNVATTDWKRIPDPTAPGVNDYTWMVREGMTPTIGTGPFTDVSGFGKYLYAEGDFGTPAVPAVFESNCFDLSSLTNPVFDFYYHGHLGNNAFDSLCVNVLTTNGWQTPPAGRITTFTQNDELDPWTYRRFDLAPYAAQGQVKLRVAAYRRTGSTLIDVAIDNLAVYNRLPQDAGIFNIQPPGLGLPLAANPLPTVHIRNFGTSNLTSVPVILEITPLCGPNQGVTTTYNATAAVNIAPGNTGTWQFPASSNIVWPEGRFEICARTNIASDVNTFNDSFCKYVTAFGTKTIPWGDDFDDCDHSSQGWFSQSGKLIWEVGTPSFGTNAAASAPNAFFTNLSGPYYPNTSEFLRLPLITGFDTVVNARLSFSQFMSSPNAHGGRMEVFISGNWVALGSVDAIGVGINWHSQPPVGIANTPLFNAPGWIANTNGWITSSYPLFDYNFSSTSLQIRYHWKSTANPAPQAGWGIDNFEINIPPQNSASPVSVRPVNNLVFPFVDQDIQVTIENTGEKILDSCKLAVSFDGGATYGNEYWYVFNPPLIKGRRATVVYPDVWPSPAPNNYLLCAATSRPNNKQDNFPSDDTLCMPSFALPEIDLANETNNEYCNDFEDPNVFNFAALRGDFSNDLPSFELGTPAQAPITGAFVGTKAWMTKLNANYFSQDNSIIVTPAFILDSNAGTTYEMTFMHNFLTERNHDGGNVEYSQDGGLTWGTLGNFDPTPDTSYRWYNQPFIFGLDNSRPGWTGNSNGWRQARLRFCFEIGGQTIFRFRFASDNNIETTGWAIDDFCLREVNEDCKVVVSTETFDLEELQFAPPAPNPANALTYIAYRLPRSGDMRVRITNLLGQVLFDETAHKDSGIGQTNFDVSGWRNGVYIISMEYEGKTYTTKLMVNK